jgi:hypothetical protein
MEWQGPTKSAQTLTRSLSDGAFRATPLVIEEDYFN